MISAQHINRLHTGTAIMDNKPHEYNALLLELDHFLAELGQMMTIPPLALSGAASVESTALFRGPAIPSGGNPDGHAASVDSGRLAEPDDLVAIKWILDRMSEICSRHRFPFDARSYRSLITGSLRWIRERRKLGLCWKSSRVGRLVAADIVQHIQKTVAGGPRPCPGMAAPHSGTS